MKEGYKKTELGIIPKEWEIKSIGNSVLVNPESLKNSIGDDFTIDYIDIESVKVGKITATKQFQFKDAPSRARRIVRKDDVIISTVRPNLKSVAKIKIEKDNLICSTGFSVLRKKQNINSEYLYQFALSDIFTKQLVDKTVGSNYPAVNSNDIKETYIFIPTINEQQKIAEILSTVDSQIDDTDKLIEKTKELKRGLMQRLLTKGIGHSEFKKSEIGEIPVEWHVDNIGSICNLINGRAFKPKEWMESGIPIIRIQNLNGSDEYNYYDGEIDEKYMIKNGDLLFSWSGSRGTSFGPHIWCKIDGVLNQHIFRVDLKEGLDKRFIYYSLKNITMKIEQEAHGSAGLVHITKGALEKINISLPIIEEQEKIANILSSVDNQIEEFEIKKEKLKEVKKGLMQQLLTGKIRVK